MRLNLDIDEPTLAKPGAKRVHLLTIGKAIVKRFKIGLAAHYITTVPVA